jgi:hypothetical protein
VAGDDDLVHRLRNPDKLDGLYSLCRKAAAEIETLRRRLDDFDEWHEHGMRQKWITYFCFTHNRYPFDTHEEAEQVEEEEIAGNDPCLHAARLTPEPPQVHP